jgi:hypothetical protein
MGMVKAKGGDDSLRERIRRVKSDYPLSAETEANLRRFALKWASVIQDAGSYEQPMRTVLEFLGTYLPEITPPETQEGQRLVKERQRMRDQKTIAVTLTAHDAATKHALAIAVRSKSSCIARNPRVCRC